MKLSMRCADERSGDSKMTKWSNLKTELNLPHEAVVLAKVKLELSELIHDLRKSKKMSQKDLFRSLLRSSKKMSEFSLKIKRNAEKEMEKFPDHILRKLIPKINHLTQNPNPPHSKKLSGHFEVPIFRIREGDYRILYAIEGTTITVFRAAHRREVYRKPFFF